MNTTPGPFFWECLVLRANGLHSFATIESFAEEFSQKPKIAACVIYVWLNVRAFARRVVSSWSQWHITCAHNILPDLFNAVSYSSNQPSFPCLDAIFWQTYTDVFCGWGDCPWDNNLGTGPVSDDSTQLGSAHSQASCTGGDKPYQAMQSVEHIKSSNISTSLGTPELLDIAKSFRQRCLCFFFCDENIAP